MKRATVIIAVLSMLVVGCAHFGSKPWADRSPAEKSLAFMQFYNSQYADTMRLATDPASTPEQKALAMKKKSVLGELWPAVKMYDSYVQSGLIVTPELEAKILELINRLGGAL